LGLGLLLAACGAPAGAISQERALADLQEMAVALFVAQPAEAGLGNRPLEYRTGTVYSVPPSDGEGGETVWQVRGPRADAIVLPLGARDRAAGVELKADVLIRYEHRACEMGTLPQSARCQLWQETTCCNRIWTWRRNEWRSEPPP
jgi:hypothetical protein